ncbi:MAG: hypothetical protein A2Y67_03365 [Candidatus Buchananbacteria bacterium RBG_13_39_9]|uniref:TrbC/VIRB2 family protein n=1 Tax=Candidatus Buchananbacteria bacterium RBG_13_39_9 TaxID=1797531 RepID=A0A1G1XSE4_9BACT|nr:MAG: hypothetical protein A2Y67_03365 [Candidatus Buchananbacteria bacterium RBG_13_39_9]
MKRVYKYLITLNLFLLPQIVWAQSDNIRDGLIVIKLPLGLPDVNLQTFVFSLINQAIGLIGIIFTVLVIYAGLLWMFSMGDEEKTKKARGAIISGIIGLLIIFTAYSSSSFIINSILNAT